MQKIIILFFFIVAFVNQLQAQEYIQEEIGEEIEDIIILPEILSDSAYISLLTSTPWDGATYAIFGHTSLRIKDPVYEFDFVYNYGIFNSSSSFFMFKFVKGETDYIIAGELFEDYIIKYWARGVGVIEQVFNLTQTEKQNLYEALNKNALPENRVYRYNYFYDNCSTRPRDMVEKYIEGKIEYTPTTKEQTYRDLVWECVDIQPWLRFGIDLVIGGDADKIISDRQKDFLPLYMMAAYEGAQIKIANDSVRPMLSGTYHLLPASPLDDSSELPPLPAGCILLALTIVISYLIYKNNWLTFGKIYDTLLFLVAGLGGSIIFFLMFFSEHPCTNPNWNIIWLNPLQLIVALLFFVKSASKYLIYYHFINFVALLLFILAWSLIPQTLEIAFIPYILTIALRSGMNILQQKKLNRKTVYSLPKTR